MCTSVDLREKIEANPSEPKYVHTKWGVGYYFNVLRQRDKFFRSLNFRIMVYSVSVRYAVGCSDGGDISGIL